MNPNWNARSRAAALIALASLAASCSDSGDSPNTQSVGITRVEITSSTPAFEGRTFGAVGAYRKLRGKAYGEIDPANLRNAVITDLALAPRNERGRVEYSMDIYLLEPADPARGNHKLFMEVNNRGNKLFGGFNQSSGGNDPGSAADAGQAFLMNQGYTLAWNGWDPSASAANNGLTISVPVAKNADGSPITGPSYEYIVFDNGTTQTANLSYPAASADQSGATLTMREHLTDPPVTIPTSGWSYASGKSIQLLPTGTPFKQSAIYEFTYVAADPYVAGIGFAATRDFVSFLRHAKADSAGTGNPLAGGVSRALAFAISQPARYLNDFVWLGFNQDLTGAKVFDGIENWIGAGTSDSLNYRFAKPARTERNRQDHLYPEGRFPFAFNTLTDSTHGQDRWPQPPLRSQQHVPEDAGDQLGQRILGEDRLAAAHGHRGQRSARSGQPALLSAVRRRAHGERQPAQLAGHLRAAAQHGRSRRPRCAHCSSHWINGSTASPRRRARCRVARTAPRCSRAQL